MKRSLLFPVLALALLGLTSAGAEKLALNPELPYRAKRGNPVTYDVDFSAVVTAPYHTKKLRVWMLLPQSDAGQEVTEDSLTTFPMDVKPRIGKEAKYGNGFAYFEFDRPQGAQILRHRFTVKVWELRWDVDRTRVTRVERWPAGFDRYLHNDPSVTLDDTGRRLLKGIVAEPRGEVEDLEAVIGWIHKNLTYDHACASLTANAKNALKNRGGHCSDYHGLCAAFGRGLGYPTRIAYGINPFPKNSPSHCKLEAYLPPYGWVSFDVEQTQKLIGLINSAKDLTPQKKAQLVKAAQARLLRGFRDNTWFIQARGTDYELVPPASQRVPLVRTLWVEADGVPLPDPDPAYAKKREFAWMTVHKYTPDRPVTYPFADWKSLEK